ncbi:heterogeneous nuclear ribonucleoprotein u like 1 [Trichuris trichiura]|uniref:Heterogeneous nuclear ribonucleoprotein u like 1 n=1 Tax=Trichuris trichiura TaxID=36087 RepID=A0A077Z4G6_TRITR|nr:heterogeneous nuclear ribonucleoprotein u like 1 [Trichuris trichiura]
MHFGPFQLLPSNPKNCEAALPYLPCPSKKCWKNRDLGRAGIPLAPEVLTPCELLQALRLAVNAKCVDSVTHSRLNTDRTFHLLGSEAQLSKDLDKFLNLHANSWDVAALMRVPSKYGVTLRSLLIASSITC